MDRARRQVLGIALVLLGLFGPFGLSGCSPEPTAGQPPNILILVLDALRADKLGAYGFDRETSPRLDALAREPATVVFRRHYVQSTWTKPSTASLFTGLYPFQHGVVGGHVRAEGNADWSDVTTPVLDVAFDTLAERLSRAGYDTFAVVKSHHLLPEYGFAQGFARYVTPAQAKGDARRVRAVLKQLRKSSRPFFGYVHLTAVHYPWPEDRRDPGYLAEYPLAYDEASRIASGVDFRGPRVRNDIRKRGLTLEAADVEFLHRIYESGVRRVDRDQLGLILDGLAEQGLATSTVLVVTADHGEELYDHRGYGHGRVVWEELSHVPLLVRFPRGRPDALGAEVDQVTRAIDLAPTLLDLAGVDPARPLPGARIFRGEFGAHALIEAKDQWALVRDTSKLLVTGETPALYDLSADPAEQRDQSEAQPSEVAALLSLAESIREDAPGLRRAAPIIDTELDPDAIRDLRQLGYIE